jgi:hypothetical protein
LLTVNCCNGVSTGSTTTEAVYPLAIILYKTSPILNPWQRIYFIPEVIIYPVNYKCFQVPAMKQIIHTYFRLAIFEKIFLFCRPGIRWLSFIIFGTGIRINFWFHGLYNKSFIFFISIYICYFFMTV